MKIVLFGSTGYIGKQLYDALIKEKHSVLGVSNKTAPSYMNHVKCDLLQTSCKIAYKNQNQTSEEALISYLDDNLLEIMQ